MFNTVMMFELEQIMKKSKVNVIDVRETYEFEEGHIKHAMNMPTSNFLERLSLIDKKETYYVVCYSGSRSQMAAQYLAKHGYKVINVLGGMSTYKGELSYEM